MRGSVALADWALDATSPDVAFGFAWLASLGGNVVLPGSEFDGREPSESNWHGKFW